MKIIVTVPEPIGEALVRIAEAQGLSVPSAAALVLARGLTRTMDVPQMHRKLDEISAKLDFVVSCIPPATDKPENETDVGKPGGD